MMIFVDYDNIEKKLLRRGIKYVVDKIVSKIDVNEINNNRRLTIRLYGGWYEQNQFTTRAQRLSTDISASYPNVATISDNTTKVIVNVEIAYSLLADPGNHLFHTFRSRGIPQGLRARHPNNSGCSGANCPAFFAYQFIASDVCSTCNIVKPKDILYRGEQKLIDTMLTSDLIFSAGLNVNLCIVSSDDDFWPGIKTTLSYGKKVIQIHTRNGNTPHFYTRTTNSNYFQKHL